jgi:ribosomal-protein-alanine N-acetyltransferase
MKLFNVKLKTERLFIREFKPSDWKDVNTYSKLKKTVRFLPWGPDTSAQTRDFLRRMSLLRHKKSALLLSLPSSFKKKTKLLVGAG